MIQRKQSIWLFLAALLSGCLFISDIYTSETTVNNVTSTTTLRILDNYPLLLIALVITILPLVTVFMYKDRKKQVRMTSVSLVGTLSFISLMLVNVTKLSNTVPPPTHGSYKVGAVLPVLSLIFIIMAMVAIRKDEKLVRSMDRLR